MPICFYNVVFQQALNPVFILIMIPIFENIVYPLLRKCNLLVRYEHTLFVRFYLFVWLNISEDCVCSSCAWNFFLNRPLQRMCAGMLLAACSFVMAAFIQIAIQVTLIFRFSSEHCIIEFFCCTSPCERPRKTSLMVSTDQIQNLTSRDLVIRVFPRFWQFEAFRILIGYLWYFPLSWLAIAFTLVLVVQPSTARTISVHCWECLWIAATSQTPFWVLNVQNNL